MHIWIDVLDASGNRYGNGPIETATGWTSELRLDQAGTFAFVMPASDPQAALLANKRYVRCWSQKDGQAKQEEGFGIIDRIRRLPSTGGPTMIEVSGDDILRELSRRNVGNLRLFNDALFDPDELTLVGGTSTILVPPFTIDFRPEPLNFLFVKSQRPYGEIRIDVGSPVNTVVAVLQAQYYSGVSRNWNNLSITDGTSSGGKPLARDGTISFSIPSDWAIYDGMYQVRLYNQNINLSPVQINSVTLMFREPTHTPLAQLMALAPPGWSLDTVAGYAEIQNPKGVYLQLSGQESFMAALGRVAEQTGEHFALSHSGRRIRWLGSDKLSSGLRAIGGSASGSPDESTMLLTDMSQTDDSYDLVTRLYPTGGGSGAGVLTLAQTTRTAPIGYALSKTENYLERTSEYGRIDAPVTYSDIAPESVFNQAVVYAANTLFDRAYEELRRVSEIQVAYEAVAIPSLYPLYPGQTIRVQYDEWYGDFHAIAVDAEVWVLGVKRQVSPEGIRTIGMTVATVDRWPGNDYREMASAIGSMETGKAQPLPTQGHTSTGKGNPYFMSISNGLVTQILRQEAVDDGRYENTRTLVIRNGSIVEIIPWV